MLCLLGGWERLLNVWSEIVVVVGFGVGGVILEEEVLVEVVCKVNWKWKVVGEVDEDGMLIKVGDNVLMFLGLFIVK